MIRIRSGDPIVVMIEVTAVMLIIVSKSKFSSFTATKCGCEISS